MLVQRIDYQCNNAFDSSPVEDSKSDMYYTLIDVMKDYSLILETDAVYSSCVIVEFEQALETE